MKAVNKSVQHIENCVLMLYPKSTSRLRAHPLFISIVYVVVLASTAFTIAARNGNLSSSPDVVDLTEDIGVFPLFVLFGVAVHFYLAFPAHLIDMLNSLIHEKVFINAELKLHNRIDWLYSSRFLYWLPLVIDITAVTIWFGVIFIDPDGVETWIEVNFVGLIVVTVLWSFAWYAVIGLLVNLALAIYLVNIIFRDNEIRVYRLHYDKCGGLRPLGKFAIQNIAVAIAYGVFLIVWAFNDAKLGTITRDYLLFANTFGYLVVVPLVFYLPMYRAHYAMIEYRNSFVRKTSDRYYRKHLEAHRDDIEPATLDETLKEMENLNELQRHELAFPVWPFSTGIRVGVLLNSIAPLALSLVSLVLESAISGS